MGGRGSSFGAEVIRVMEEGGRAPTAEPLIVAGMTPADKGSHFTNEEKTLSYIEGQKRDYKKEQLQIIDEYGYVTKAYQGDEHSVGVTVEAAAYMKGKMVTHNHPAAYGGTFSGADVKSLRFGMKELRASAKEGIYAMRARPKADPAGFYQAYERDAGKMQEQMQAIANQQSKKKWKSEESYQINNRREQLQVMHQWYMENAPEYGYEYRFHPTGKEEGEP